jgi:hypothetical protein
VLAHSEEPDDIEKMAGIEFLAGRRMPSASLALTSTSAIWRRNLPWDRWIAYTMGATPPKTVNA